MVTSTKPRTSRRVKSETVRTSASSRPYKRCHFRFAIPIKKKRSLSIPIGHVRRYYKEHDPLTRKHTRAVLYICLAHTGTANDVSHPNRLPRLVTQALGNLPTCLIPATLVSPRVIPVCTTPLPSSRAYPLSASSDSDGNEGLAHHVWYLHVSLLLQY